MLIYFATRNVAEQLQSITYLKKYTFLKSTLRGEYKNANNEYP